MTEQVEIDDKPAGSENLPEAKPTEAAEADTSPAAETQPADAPVEGVSTLPPEEIERLTGDIIAALKTVYDPEIPADIYELGLIYKIDINDDREIAVEMTLTAPGCPVAGEMPVWVENAVSAVPGVSGVTVTLTFDPPWDQSRMSDEARLALNMF
ncbi:MAG TPA: SUF system Fe-S cluster assembly protein [Hyphomicrobium sp.]|nr:SUF system Fe-S cluster assembly protein [Hyphomicrobium sp.]HRO49788.1 SUF system Fe-S cluster assembly protein [Hyphomicrobium sp.]